MTDTIHSGSSPPLRILLIDDEEEILATVGQLLRRMGYEVSTAGNGAEGLERFERDGADIVVSDVMMPGIDGLGVLRGLRALGADVEVILITGVGTMDTAVEALRQGAFDFFTKPVRIAELTASLERTRRYQEVRRDRDRLRSRLANLEPDGSTLIAMRSAPAAARRSHTAVPMPPPPPPTTTATCPDNEISIVMAPTFAPIPRDLQTNTCSLRSGTVQHFDRDHEIEHFRRSLAMLPAGSDALKREEAMALLGRLRDVTARLRRLEEGMRALLADETPR